MLVVLSWLTNNSKTKICKEAHSTKLCGIASTLRLRTVTSTEQWQPWTALAPLFKAHQLKINKYYNALNCGLKYCIFRGKSHNLVTQNTFYF